MQEKPLLNQTNSTSNILSMDFGSVSYDIFGSPYKKSGSFLATDSLDFGYLGKPYNADTAKKGGCAGFRRRHQFAGADRCSAYGCYSFRQH